MKRFDVHGWDYAKAHENITELITRMSQRSRTRGDLERAREFYGQHGEVPDSWWDLGAKLDKVLSESGGKAFGFTLCGNQFGRLIVPGWFAPDWSSEFMFHKDMERLENWLIRNPHHIIRSSHPEEDWIDPRSGVYKSVICWRPEEVKSQLQEMWERGEWGIVQSLENGIGFVVDIGYSELLEMSVARIAHGNTSVTGSGDRYTSATWDHEAHVGIYEADGLFIGRPVVPLASEKFAQIAPRMVQCLVDLLSSLGISFGVQFEIVIHPERPEVANWWLVQMRPSPEAVRGPHERPLIRGKLIATTGKVSGAGVAEGDVLVAKWDRPHWHTYEEMRKDCQGKVIVWDRQRMNRYGVDYLIDAGKCGAVGQLTWHHIIVNSGHGTFAKLGELHEGEYRKACEASLLAALDGEPLRQEWYRRLYTGGTARLRLISDGLVGQVWLV